VVSQSEICIRDGEHCGTTVSISKTPCCGCLKCVMDAAHPAPCRGQDCKPYTFKCLDCNDEFNGLCGGPNNIKCCPISYCARKDENDKTSFGKCLPYV
jgi:hypothetical protein